MVSEAYSVALLTIGSFTGVAISMVLFFEVRYSGMSHTWYATTIACNNKIYLDTVSSRLKHISPHDVAEVVKPSLTLRYTRASVSPLLPHPSTAKACNISATAPTSRPTTVTINALKVIEPQFNRQAAQGRNRSLQTASIHYSRSKSTEIRTSQKRRRGPSWPPVKTFSLSLSYPQVSLQVRIRASQC
jgi:hypothetical protein